MIQAVHLRTEYLSDPLGIDIRSPRLSWTVQDAVRQSAYQIRFSLNGGEWMELEKTETDRMTARPEWKFTSRDRVIWQIRLTDEKGETGEWSESASFEMGLLDRQDWSARWITGNYTHSSSGKDRYPADCFRKVFSVDGEIRQARLYITACGIYEARINGKKAGDQVLCPGSTAFQKRVHYQTYDVTSLIDRENVWDIDLADGYYASNMGVFNKAKPFGYEPKVLAQLEICKTDGSLQCVFTDRDFLWCNDGPVRFADMKDGESIDFNFVPHFQGKAAVTDYNGIIDCSDNSPIHEKERFSTPEILTCPDGNKVLDFGQNIAGYVEVKLCGKKGDRCSMVFGEKLDDSGCFTYRNISSEEYDKCHFQTIDFVCDGKPHVYKPRFTVMGFRYVLLRDWRDEILPENFTAIAVYSDMDVTFRFDSSDPELNQIVHNTFWSMKGNFLDVPTDCPTRERAGWTGDAQLFFNTGNYMMDQRAFFRKWLRDVADCQKESGLVYNVNPSAPSGSAVFEWVSMEGSSGWGDAMITIPYYFWKRYGDDALIREFWGNMKKCFSFFYKRTGKRNLLTLFSPPRSRYDRYIVACGRHFGEWTEPEDCAPGKLSLVMPACEEATAYLSYSAALMGEMASHLGRESAAEKYRKVAEQTREAYNHYFVKDGSIKSERMCKYVRPCGLNLARGGAREKLLEKIVLLNRKRNYRIGTGFLTTPFVFETLSEAGASDDAYRTLMNPELGWVQQVRQGATTVWENWTPDASLNHYSKGACCQWLFDCLCGVKLDGHRNHFVIEPHIVSQLSHIRFSYDSVYGTVSSGWEKTTEGHCFRITVPANCTADVILPGGDRHSLSAGAYTFSVAQ